MGACIIRQNITLPISFFLCLFVLFPMALNCSSSAAKHLALVVFICGLLSQYQLEARATQFFSKVPTAPSNSNSSSDIANAAKEQGSSEKGYGLVYDDNVSDTTTTKSNNENYNYMGEQASELDGTTDQGYPTTYNDKAYVTKPQGYKPNNNYGSYEKEQQEVSVTSLLDQDAGHSTTYNNNDYGTNTFNPQQQEFSQEEKDAVLNYNTNTNNNKYNYNYNYNGEEAGYNNNVNNNNNNNYRFNGQQEGMSDTRFLENGKYHYNVKAEDQYNNNLPNHYSGNNNNNYNNYNNNNANNYNNNNNYDADAENEEFDAFNP